MLHQAIEGATHFVSWAFFTPRVVSSELTQWHSLRARIYQHTQDSPPTPRASLLALINKHQTLIDSSSTPRAAFFTANRFTCITFTLFRPRVVPVESRTSKNVRHLSANTLLCPKLYNLSSLSFHRVPSQLTVEIKSASRRIMNRHSPPGSAGTSCKIVPGSVAIHGEQVVERCLVIGVAR